MVLELSEILMEVNFFQDIYIQGDPWWMNRSENLVINNSLDALSI